MNFLDPIIPQPREARLKYLDADYQVAGKLFSVPFDVKDPSNTPRGLADGPLALENPTGVAARGDTVYVVEMGAGRVSAWEIGGR